MKNSKRLFVAIAFTIMLSFSVIFSAKAEAAGKVKLNKTRVVLEMDQQFKLKLKKAKGSVKWTTSNKKVVKVKKGTLTPVSVGSAVVSAKANGNTYSCRVVVVDYTGMSKEQKEVID